MPRAYGARSITAVRQRRISGGSPGAVQGYVKCFQADRKLSARFILVFMKVVTQ